MQVGKEVDRGAVEESGDISLAVDVIDRRLRRGATGEHGDVICAYMSRKPDAVGIGHADDDRELVATVAAKAGTFLDDSLT